MSNDALLLVGRILLVTLFLVSGLGMLAAPGGFAGYMASIGMPAPMIVTWLVIALKVLGGLAILVGFRPTLPALLLAGFCIATALIAHMDFADQNQFNAFFKNIAIAGGFLLLAATGPGRLALGGAR
jgi:putative oxidoreductase